MEASSYVADSANHQVQKVTADGKFLAAVGGRGMKKLQFNHPYGIAVHISNNIVYVADTWNDRVQVLTSDLNFHSFWGSSSRGHEKLYYPRDIACDSARKAVYVADERGMKVFTEEGKFVRLFVTCGTGEEELSKPTGIAVDKNGIVYVSDEGKQCISLFTSNGQFVKSIRSVKCPRGLAVDDNGVVYVCDRDNYLVQMF